jgi:hypothetical protein
LDDFRWDKQIDNRGRYYGALVQELGLELDALQPAAHPNDESVSSQAVDILAYLANHGGRDAVAILLLHVKEGQQFPVQHAVKQLVAMDLPGTRGALRDALINRFTDPEELFGHLPGINPDEAPWKEWSKADDAFGKAVRMYKRAPHEEAYVDDASLSIAELLDRAAASHRYPGIKDALGARLSESDTAELIEEIDISRPQRTIAALQALAPRKDVRILGPATAIIEQWRPPFDRSWRKLPGGHPIPLRIWASRAIAALPCELTLPLARKWRSSRRWGLTATARTIFDKCLTSEDVVWIRQRLGVPITDRNVYQICDYAEWLAKFPDRGPFRALRRIYGEFPYSYGRRFVVAAMASTDPRFPSELAYECLWDCEAATRITATRSVDLDVRGATVRLQALADDNSEDEEVRKTAAARLAA